LNRQDSRPRLFQTTWPALIKALTSYIYLVDKHAAELWSPARFQRGKVRAKANVVEVSVLVFDIDDGTDASTVEYWLGLAGLSFVIQPSYSHTPDHPKLRVVIRLTEPIPANEFDETWRRANQHLMHGHVDPSTKDASRMFYRPSCPPGAQPVTIVHDGTALDWRALPPVPPSRPVPKHTPGVPTGGSDLEARATALLNKWDNDLAAMPANSGRHNRLLELARAAGGLVASGLLNRADVEGVLFGASEANRLVQDDGDASVQRTIRDGLDHGAQAPWTPDDLPDSPNWHSSPQIHLGQSSVNGSASASSTRNHTTGGSSGPTVDDDEITLPAAPTFPVDVLPPVARRVINESSLPAALLAGPMLGAFESAAGGNVEVQYSAAQIERPIAVIVGMAPKSAGKSPGQRIALQPLVYANARLREQYHAARQAWRSTPAKQRGSRPINHSFIRRRITPEGLLRDMDKQPSLLACPDELEATLRDLAGYRVEDSRTSGLTILLELWTGTPQDYTRVGRSENESNAVEIYIPRPTLVFVGTLQTVRHTLLGPTDDGIRPRWLLHLADRPEPCARRDPSQAALDEYERLITRIFNRRGVRRRWVLGDQAKSRFDQQVLEWKQRGQLIDVNDAYAAALDKADSQVLKFVGGLAETTITGQLPNGPYIDVEGEQVLLLDVPLDVLESAITWMEFILDCWACLQGGAPLARTYQERALIEAASRVMEYVDERGHPVTGSTLRHHNVGGIQTARQLKVVLDTVEAMSPGTVEVQATGGRPSTVVKPRKRAAPNTRGKVTGTP
jgi:hypothetical protein